MMFSFFENRQKSFYPIFTSKGIEIKNNERRYTVYAKRMFIQSECF